MYILSLNVYCLTFDCSPGKPSWRTSNYAYDALAPFDIIDEDCGLAFVPDGPEGNMFIFKQVIRLLCDNEYNNANIIDPSLIGTLCSDLSQLYVFSNFEERVKEVLREGPLFAAKATIMQEARFEKTVAQINASIDQTASLAYDASKTATEALLKSTAADHKSSVAIARASTAVSTAKEAYAMAQQASLGVKANADRLAAVEQRQLSSMPSPLYYYSKCCTVNSVIRRGNPDPVAIEEMLSIVRCLDQLAPHPGRCFRGLDMEQFSNEWLCRTFPPWRT